MNLEGIIRRNNEENAEKRMNIKLIISCYNNIGGSTDSNSSYNANRGNIIETVMHYAFTQ